VAEPSGNPPGPPHACRTRTLRMPAKTPLAGDNIDAPAACALSFRPYCGGVATRTRNVSEYVLVLALCLVFIAVPKFKEENHMTLTSPFVAVYYLVIVLHESAVVNLYTKFEVQM